MGLSYEIRVLTPQTDGSLAELRRNRQPPPTPRKTLRFKIVPVFVDIYRQQIKTNCWREAFVANSPVDLEFIMRTGSFISVLDIEWIRCHGEEEKVFIIDGKQLHLPHLSPITEPDQDLRVFGIVAIDYEHPQKWSEAEEQFRTTNEYAWEIKKYSLLNCTFDAGSGETATGHMIGYSRNPLDSYAITNNVVYGLTESSVASQTISDIMKLIPNYWILKFLFSLFDVDIETQLTNAFDWLGDFFKNLYFFSTRGILLFLAMYYLVRMFFGDGWVGIITSILVANFVRLQGYYD